MGIRNRFNLHRGPAVDPVVDIVSMYPPDSPVMQGELTFTLAQALAAEAKHCPADSPTPHQRAAHLARILQAGGTVLKAQHVALLPPAEEG